MPTSWILENLSSAKESDVAGKCELNGLSSAKESDVAGKCELNGLSPQLCSIFQYALRRRRRSSITSASPTGQVRLSFSSRS